MDNKSEELFGKAFRSLLAGEKIELTEEEKKLVPADISQHDWETLVKRFNETIERVNFISKKLGIIEEDDDGS